MVGLPPEIVSVVKRVVLANPITELHGIHHAAQAEELAVAVVEEAADAGDKSELAEMSWIKQYPLCNYSTYMKLRV